MEKKHKHIVCSECLLRLFVQHISCCFKCLFAYGPFCLDLSTLIATYFLTSLQFIFLVYCKSLQGIMCRGSDNNLY